MNPTVTIRRARWRVVWAVVRKDIVDAVKNQFILFGLILPILMALLFRIVFPSSDSLDRLVIAVYDAGNSRLVAELRELPQVQLIEVASEQRLAEAVEDNAVGGLAIPAGFDAAVDAGERPELAVHVTHQAGSTIKLAAFQQLVEERVWRLSGEPPPARIRWIDANPSLSTVASDPFRLEHYLFILLLVLALLMAGVWVVPLLVVEEKEKRTLAPLLLSPASLGEVVAGKALAGLAFSLLVAGALVALYRGWAGDWPITGLAVILGALLMVGIGLLMGSVFRTAAQVNIWATVVMLILLVPSWVASSGFLSMPAPLQTTMRLLPTYYLVDALGLTLAGQASLAWVWGDLAVLAGSALVVFAGVVWTLRREANW